MRAVLVDQFRPFEEVILAETPDPTPDRGEVVVDVVAAEANYPDILVIEGNYRWKSRRRPGRPSITPRIGPGTSCAKWRRRL